MVQAIGRAHTRNQRGRRGSECVSILPVKKPVTSTHDNNNCEDLHTPKKIVCKDGCLARCRRQRFYCSDAKHKAPLTALPWQQFYGQSCITCIYSQSVSHKAYPFIYMMSSDFISIHQVLITEVIRRHKCRMNMGPILNGYGGMGSQSIGQGTAHSDTA
jgi:hypothetical protein